MSEEIFKLKRKLGQSPYEKENKYSTFKKRSKVRQN